MKKPGFFALQAICNIIFSVLYYTIAFESYIICADNYADNSGCKMITVQ